VRHSIAVSKHFRSCGLDQLLLLPPSLQDWLPEDHLARFIGEVAEELDMTAIYADYERRDGRGLAAYHPLLLTRLLLYGYCTGTTSSRRIEKATHDDIAFRYLAADQHPDHDTIANFRQQHLAALAGLFVQALRLCQKAGFVKLGTVAIDGSKMLANASKHQSLSYPRLNESEQRWKKVVDELLAQAQRTDEEEDQRHGKGQRERMLPPELARAQGRLARIRAAKQELEREAQQQLETVMQKYQPAERGRPRKDEPSPALTPELRQKLKTDRRRAKQNVLQPSRQYNFVDPDSRVMRDNGRQCYVQAYNAQLAVDALTQVIVAAELTQQVVDRQQLLPMVQSLQTALQDLPESIVADAGYWNTMNIQDPLLDGVQVLVAPDAQIGAPLAHCAPRNEAAVAMRELLSTEAGRALYAVRKRTVEPVFGQIKEARGIRRFRLRSLVKAAAEWKLICATHNLLKLYRHGKAKNGPQKPRTRTKRTRRQEPQRSSFHASCRPSHAGTDSTTK